MHKSRFALLAHRETAFFFSGQSHCGYEIKMLFNAAWHFAFFFFGWFRKLCNCSTLQSKNKTHQNQAFMFDNLKTLCWRLKLFSPDKSKDFRLKNALIIRFVMFVSISAAWWKNIAFTKFSSNSCLTAFYFVKAHLILIKIGKRR